MNNRTMKNGKRIRHGLKMSAVKYKNCMQKHVYVYNHLIFMLDRVSQI